MLNMSVSIIYTAIPSWTSFDVDTGHLSIRRSLA